MLMGRSTFKRRNIECKTYMYILGRRWPCGYQLSLMAVQVDFESVNFKLGVFKKKNKSLFLNEASDSVAIRTYQLVLKEKGQRYNSNINSINF